MNRRILLAASVGYASGLAAGADSKPATGHKSPIIASLDHFRYQRDIWLPPKCRNRTNLLVHHEFEATTGFIGRGQMASDLGREKWQIPEEARADIERRCKAREPFDVSALPDFIRALNLEKPEGIADRLDFSERHPNAKCHIRLWPAGFTRNGSHALVRFLFGPTPHGATATYLLEKVNGLWHVRHWAVAYYA